MITPNKWEIMGAVGAILSIPALIISIYSIYINDRAIEFDLLSIQGRIKSNGDLILLLSQNKQNFTPSKVTLIVSLEDTDGEISVPMRMVNNNVNSSTLILTYPGAATRICDKIRSRVAGGEYPKIGPIILTATFPEMKLFFRWKPKNGHVYKDQQINCAE